MHGTREWTDYQVSTAITPTWQRLAALAHVQGMQRYYALLLCRDGKARLVKALDGIAVQAEKDLARDLRHTKTLALLVADST